MSRDNIIRPYLNKYASHFPLDEVPPLDNLIQHRIGSQLPQDYWRLTLISRSFLNEYECDKSIVKLLIELFEIYGHWSVDWCLRKYAVVKKGNCDAKRISDFTQTEAGLFNMLNDEWKLESYIRFGVGLRSMEPSRIQNQVARVLGAISVYFGPDSLTQILGSNLNTIYDEQQKSLLSDFADYKTILQEESQCRFHKLPVYDIINESGSDHEKVFQCRVSVSGHHAIASGVSKKKAEKLAARELLTLIDSSLSSIGHISATGNRRFEPARHQIPYRQAARLQKAETYLKYSFRTRELLSSALLHQSFINEVRFPTSARFFNYEALASVGSAAVHLIALDYCMEHLPSLISNDIDNSILLFKSDLKTSADDLAKTETALILSSLLMVGKGLEGLITTKIKSEVVQSVLAAILFDCKDEEWSDKLQLANVVVKDICQNINVQNVSTFNTVEPKTLLQEILQPLRCGLQYQLAAIEGPAHKQRFKSALLISVSSTGYRFYGAYTSSKRESEKSAATLVLRYLAALNPLSPDNNVIFAKSEAAKQFALDAVKRIVEVLNLGQVGWKRASKYDLLGICALLKEDKVESINYLNHLNEFALLLGDSDVLRAFADSLSNAPVKRISITDYLSAKFDQWNLILSSVQPDNLDEASISHLLRELQLSIAVANYESHGNDSSLRPFCDLIKALNIAAHEVQYDKYHLDNVVATELIDLIVVIAGFIRDEGGSLLTLSIEQLNADSIVVTANVAPSSQSMIEFLATVLRNVNIAVEVNYPIISIKVINIGIPDRISWNKLAWRNLQRTNSADRDQLKYAAQLLHDAKNNVITARDGAQLSKLDYSKRFTQYASIERALCQARSTIAEARLVINSISNLNLTIFYLRPFIADIVADIMRQLPRNIVFSSSIDGADIEYEGDEDALRSAVMNMVKNAASAAGSNGDLRIESIYDSSNNIVLIEVSNSGNPIPESVLAAISSNVLPRSSTHNGYGLGIASVIRVARAHGGRFILSNRNGRAIASLEIPTAPNVPDAIRDNIQIDTEE